MNHLLVEAGLQTGKPGAYGLSDLGKTFGDTVDRENGYGGYAYREWSWNRWDESVIEKLGATPEKIKEMTDSLRAAKAANRAADKVEAEEAFAAFMAAKAGAVLEDTTDGGLTNGQKVIIAVGVTVIVVVGGVIIYKSVKRHRQKKAARAERDAARSSH